MALPNRIVNAGLWLLPQLHPSMSNGIVPTAALCKSGEIMPPYDCALCCFSVTLGAPIAAGSVTIALYNVTQGNQLMVQETIPAGPRMSYQFTYDPQIDIGLDSVIRCHVTTTPNMSAGFASMAVTPGFSF